jgi:cyclohexadienyl dehydratase
VRQARIALALLVLAASPAARGQGALPTVLRVGTSGDYAPFSIAAGGAHGRGEAPSGFDVAVAERFAAEAGLRIEWVAFRWPDLGPDVAAGRFDVAMSGVTWTPERATQGFLTRAVAASGPCWLGASTPKRVGVNRGGALERFARRRFADARIETADNQALPDLLARGVVDAIVTDRFERVHWNRRGWPEHCEPAADRKVYWVTPDRAGDLGPRLDAWLARNEPALDALRARWLGGSAPRTEIDHLIDLLARRLALMPAVARAKRDAGQPLVDAAREAAVVEAARARAPKAGLDADSLEALFRLQIALATQVQERTQRDPSALADAPALDLAQALRPAIGALGERIVAALATSAPLAPAALDATDWTPLAPWLDAAGRAALRDALAAVRRAH